MNSSKILSEKHLIKLDIDGTSTNSDFSTLNKDLKIVLQKLMKQGHKICFTTGRNYLSALPFYKEVGLDTFLVTYNGAFINNPSKNDAKELVFNPIANQIVKDILDEPIIKKKLCNVLIDRIDRKTISTSDDIYYEEIFFNGNDYEKGENKNILQLLEGQDSLQLVLEFDFPKKGELFNDVLMLLHNEYGAAVTFYSGNKLKEDPKKPGVKILIPDPEKTIIKIRNKFASKGMGAEWVASYYKIPLSHTIAFGNDVNDIELMRTVGKGIVTADSDNHLKETYAYAITDFGLFNSDGVTKYLKKYFNV